MTSSTSRAALVALSILCASAPAQGADLMRCKALDSVTMGDDGVMSREGAASVGLMLYADFIIDLETGMVRNQVSANVWKKVREGDGGNDWVFTAVDFNASEGSGGIMRVRNWDETDVPLFLVFGLSEMTTGTCERLM